MIRVETIFVIALASLYNIQECGAVCEPSQGDVSVVYGPFTIDGNDYRCWYTGPSYTACTGECPGNIGTSLPKPYMLSTMVEVCKCCHTDLTIVTEPIWHCVSASGDPTAEEVHGAYYTFGECSCHRNRDIVKRSSNTRANTRRCRIVQDPAFKAPCAPNVEVCWSRTRPTIKPESFARISTEVIEKLKNNEEGSFPLSVDDYTEQPYTPHSWDINPGLTTQRAIDQLVLPDCCEVHYAIPGYNCKRSTRPGRCVIPQRGRPIV